MHVTLKFKAILQDACILIKNWKIIALRIVCLKWTDDPSWPVVLWKFAKMRYTNTVCRNGVTLVTGRVER